MRFTLFKIYFKIINYNENLCILSVLQLFKQNLSKLN